MISVVIPVLDDALLLGETLEQVATLPGIGEVIVADGGSRDGSTELAIRHGHRVVRSGPGRGLQLNAGARLARFPTLLFLHADCRPEVAAFAEARARLDAPGVAAVVFRQRIDRPGLAYRLIERWASFRSRVLGLPYGDSGLLLWRTLFEAVGGFPDVPLCEDLGIARRLRRRGRIAVTHGSIRVSARRWEACGLARTSLLNGGVALAYLLGVDPRRLYRVYYGRRLEPTVGGPRG